MLAKGLQANHSLVKLDLADNALQSDQVAGLLEVLTQHQYLGLLSLRKNRLDDEFASRLCALLKENSVLYKADVSANPITNRGA